MPLYLKITKMIKNAVFDIYDVCFHGLGKSNDNFINFVLLIPAQQMKN